MARMLAKDAERRQARAAGQKEARPGKGKGKARAGEPRKKGSATTVMTVDVPH